MRRGRGVNDEKRCAGHFPRWTSWSVRRSRDLSAAILPPKMGIQSVLTNKQPDRLRVNVSLASCSSVSRFEETFSQNGNQKLNSVYMIQLTGITMKHSKTERAPPDATLTSFSMIRYRHGFRRVVPFRGRRLATRVFAVMRVIRMRPERGYRRPS